MGGLSGTPSLLKHNLRLSSTVIIIIVFMCSIIILISDFRLNVNFVLSLEFKFSAAVCFFDHNVFLCINLIT